MHVLFCLVNDPISLLDSRRQVMRIYMKKSFISSPKKAGRPLLTNIANKRVLSEVKKMKLVIIYKELKVEIRENVPSAKQTLERNAVNATLVNRFNVWQHGMNDS